MANRYNDQDYPRYNERDDRYDSRSEYGDSGTRHNRDFRDKDRGRGSDPNAGYYGTNYNSQDRDNDDFQSNSRSSRPYTGNFGRNAENDRTDYTLYGYDRENQYSSGSDEERGYYNRGGDYGYGSNFGSSGSNFDRMNSSDYTRRGSRSGGSSNFDRMDASDYERRDSRDYGRGSGRDRTEFNRGESNYEQGGYRGDYMNSERGWETENRGGSNRDDRGWWDKTTDEVSSWFGDEEAARRREMDTRQSGGYQTSHRGKGPKNYRRSDERIRDDINDRLTDYPYLDASDIEVEVNGGEVTLTGTVESRYAKRMAEDITEDISGVKNVENRLRVRQDTSNFGSTGTSNFSSGETNTGTTNNASGGNLTTGSTAGITGASSGTSTGSTTDTSLGTSTGADAATGNTSTTGNASTGNMGETSASTSTGRSRSKSA